MNLGLFRREHMQSGDVNLIGSSMADQFQRTHGAINAWQEVEHNDDGTHKDITATSIIVSPGGIAVAGDLISQSGSLSLQGGQVQIGYIGVEQGAGMPPQFGGYGVKLGPWRIISDEQHSPSSPVHPGLNFQYLNETVGQYLFRFYRLGLIDWVFTSLPGVNLRLGEGGSRLASVDTKQLNVQGAATVVSLTASSDIVAYGNISSSASINGANIGIPAGGAYYDGNYGGRIQGFWTDVPYSPSLFTTQNGPPWTVPSSSYRYRYTIIGRTFHCQFVFAPTSVAAGAGITLNVYMPAGINAGPSAIGAPIALVPYAINAGAQAVPGTYIQFQATSMWALVNLAGWGTAANNTLAYGSFTVEIQ